MTASYSFKEGESAVENPDLIPSAELAYLGDSVIEVLVRERLVLTPSPQASSKRSLAFVTAVAQSKALDNIIPMFTEEESDVFRRGRNCVHPDKRQRRRIQARDRNGVRIRLPMAKRRA